MLIIGSTGGTGRQLVRQALDLGHSVRALARKPEKVRMTHDRLTVVEGNVLDPSSLDQAVKGMDAVVSVLGHKRWFIPTRILSDGTRNVVRAMEKHGVKRFVCQTSLGVADSRGRMGLYYTLFVVPVILFFYFRDKARQEAIVRESTLDWTIVRPGQLTNGRLRGTYRHGTRLGSYILTRTISRADTAHFILHELDDPSYIRKTVELVS